MTTNNEGGVAPAPQMQPETGPILSLQSVYLKDCSYEAPNGPRVEGNWNPQINLDLHTGVTNVTPEAREVVLTVTVSAKQNENTLFLVEVKQAGLFLMRNLTEEDAKRAATSICPSAAIARKDVRGSTALNEVRVSVSGANSRLAMISSASAIHTDR